MALIYGDVRFEKGISIFRCVFGRYALARIFWVGKKTMLDAIKMQLPLLWVPLEISTEDLPSLPEWLRVAFPRGLRFDSTAMIKYFLQRSNGLFFDCKCLLWNATCAGLVGTLAAVPTLALTVAGVDPGSLVAPASASRCLLYTSPSPRD